jgi:putative ubiquitin-RnfH superfamily antitoxin RatB of RatAB toxin-antitoxin module
LIAIEVAYALSDNQLIIELQTEQPCTAGQAILQSGMLQKFPDIDLSKNKIGIFSEICTPSKLLQDNDRVEIYRQLQIDPMEARRHRAVKQAQ